MIAVNRLTPLAWTWYVLAGASICVASAWVAGSCRLTMRARSIQSAIDSRAFPAAAAEIGRGDGAIWSAAFGRVTFDPDSAATTPGTIFDLASLTKPIATTTVAMGWCETGPLRLEMRVADFFDEWRGADREAVTVRDLLEHASGLPARLVDPPPVTRREFAHEICAIKLEYPPRTRSIYSDLGFILLGLLARRCRWRRATRRSVRADRAQAEAVSFEPRGASRRAPAVAESRRSAWTSDDVLGVRRAARGSRACADRADARRSRRGRRLVGEVHDNYAAALGGVAGHAGLFGNAAGVGAFARAMLRAARGGGTAGRAVLARRSSREFTTKSTVPGSSRALGWDTMLPTSSCGDADVARAFGHVG